MKMKTLALAATVGGVALAAMGTFAEDNNAMHKLAPATEMAPTESRPYVGDLSSLGRATEWISSPALSGDSLRGKVVLIDFWTYTCINWQRQLPYVRAWAEKYKNQGLVVVGVHSPEFAFERNIDNVRQAAKRLNVDYPVAIDNDFAIWRAFGNAAWPALFFIDAQGRTRRYYFGEGQYEQSERFIQKLLAEAGASGADREPVSVMGVRAEAAADWAHLRSPESYLGYERTERTAFVPVRDKSHVYPGSGRLGVNTWSLAGDWTVNKGSVVLNKPDGRIAYRFHARDLHLVMGRTTPGSSVRFRVLVDGKPPGAAHGTDIDEQGIGTVGEQRMYQLIRQPKPITDRLFEIEFLDRGAEAFAFTFG